MARHARSAAGNFVYHVLNRGNARQRVFHKDPDYAAFLDLIGQACRRQLQAVPGSPMRVLAWCLMPNHFHLVLWPTGDGELSKWMGWLGTTHARRYRLHYRDSGHIWQGRFKSFPVEEDEHLYDVLRYVERNALRAGLVKRAQDWPWGSLSCRAAGGGGGGQRPAFLSQWPVDEPRDWVEIVNRPQTEAELARMRQSVEKGRPYGEAGWMDRTVERLGLQPTLRGAGRPRNGRNNR